MDTDGKHIWWEHECLKDGQRVTLRWMLPFPHWKHNGAQPPQNAHVTPSIVCEVSGCGYHAIPLIGEPPSDWEPRRATSSTPGASK
jgi:hypothetical protein